MRIRFIRRILNRLFNAWLCCGVKSNHHQNLAKVGRIVSVKENQLNNKLNISGKTLVYIFI